MSSETTGAAVAPDRSLAQSWAFVNAYRLFGYFGLFSIYAALIFGFRFSTGAAQVNFAIDLGLYALFIVPHLIMTRSWFKKAIWGNPAGSPGERRVYIFVTVVTWLALLAFHLPLPGFAFVAPDWVRFCGLVFLLMGFMLFFQGVLFSQIDGLLGVPGSVSAYSHGPETPLFTEGPYATVRHPMYRGVLLAGAASLLIHPTSSQLFWILLLGATFVGFIPVEESQLLRARGDDYRAYMAKTRWRIIPGIW